jgi:FkbM family methyltransferase
VKLLRNLRGVLTSRKFFSNWWFLPLKFVSGAGKFEVRCRDGGDLILNRFEYRRFIVALRDSLISNVSCIDRTFTSTNGSTYPLDKLFSLDYTFLRALSKEGCVFDFVNGYWVHRVSGLKFKELRTGVVEVLCLGHYPLDNIDLRDREVVDVGAFVGDSTLYFLYKGAEKVIAIEPHRGAYEEMLYNLKLNGLEHKVIAINAALGGMERTLRMPADLSIDDTIGFNHLSTNIREGIEVKVITLKEVMKYVKDPYLIKMDCEDCEYEVINHSFSILTKFKYILLEYHNADISEHKKTLEKLSNNFVCREIPYELFTHEGWQGVMLCRNRELA